jgi:hypothetical protein
MLIESVEAIKMRCESDAIGGYIQIYDGSNFDPEEEFGDFCHSPLSFLNQSRFAYKSQLDMDLESYLHSMFDHKLS